MIPGVSDNHEIALAWAVISVAFFFWGLTRLISFWMRPNREDASRFATMFSMGVVAIDTVHIRWSHVSSNSDRSIYIRWFAAFCVSWALFHSIQQVRRDMVAYRRVEQILFDSTSPQKRLESAKNESSDT